MAKTELITIRVDPELKRLLAEVAQRDGHGMSELLRSYAKEQISAQHQADVEAEAWIRENLGEKAIRMVEGLNVRPSGYLEQWRKANPPEPTPEERRAAELEVAAKMGLTIEDYDEGKER